MTPEDFAQKHFPNYRSSGNEIIPIYCPYCHGGNGKDKYTFALNAITGNFNCKRGSCGKSGTFRTLLRDHGEEMERQKNYESIARVKKNYKTPTTKINTANAEAKAYLSIRGFSQETWELRGVGSDDSGNIAMPYYEGGKLVLIKFRPARKPRNGERKAWREEGGKPVFWGMDQCTEDKPLVIVEGEMDALALDECGIKNVVSVPSGAEDLTCFDLCWEWLKKFKQIILWADNDGPGRELQRNLINRLGAWRCWTVQAERKDANEVLYYDGKEKVVEVFSQAKEVPISGLIRLADVKAFDYSKSVRVKSGIRGLDKALGGFFMGQWTVWTGSSSSGKSTLLGQLLLESVEQGYPVCAYSGELPAPLFRYWIDLQAAGTDNLVKKYDSIKEEEIAYPKQETTKLIREWYRDKFFLYDSYGMATDETLFEVFEYAAMRYGCKVFMIDNLMTVTLNAAERDFYMKQTAFVNKVAEFAQRLQVHVHLVAHPRKPDGKYINKITKMDVKGAGSITDRADNVLAVNRLTEDEQEKKLCDTVLEIFKNRMFGKQDIEIQLKFEPSCKLFYMADDICRMTYSWRKFSFEDIKYDESELPF